VLKPLWQVFISPSSLGLGIASHEDVGGGSSL